VAENDAKDERAATIEIDPHLQIVLLAVAHVASQRLHEQRGGAYTNRGVVSAPERNASDRHVAVAICLDLEQVELASDDVNARKISLSTSTHSAAPMRADNAVKPTRSTNMTEAAS